MAKQTDSLRVVEGPDRVHYETGVLLNADDFVAEQNYHRGRLARALGYINGEGTLAGLEVTHEADVPAVDPDPGREERILIAPGLAIDRLGRLIEVSHDLCLRIGKWYAEKIESDADALERSWHDTGTIWTDSVSGVVVDVFIRFLACERGKTPSFAYGPFDSLDAVTAARVRDGYQLELILREEADPALPQSAFPNLLDLVESKRPEALRKVIFDAWHEGTDYDNLGQLIKKPEHAIGQDASALFLARMIIPADEPVAGGTPERRDTENLEIRNDLRQFVITGNALAAMLGIQIKGGKIND
jgi:hypothetical protein